MLELNLVGTNHGRSEFLVCVYKMLIIMIFSKETTRVVLLTEKKTVTELIVNLVCYSIVTFFLSFVSYHF